MEAVESEEALVTEAVNALNASNWVVGECAAKWTARYANGRTDADFGQLVGLTADQVYQRRRVWDMFAKGRFRFPSLSWSHFYTALNWDDSDTALAWASEQEATVAEMRAWQKARTGGDLFASESDDSRGSGLSLGPVTGSTSDTPVAAPKKLVKAAKRSSDKKSSGEPETKTKNSGTSPGVPAQGEHDAPPSLNPVDGFRHLSATEQMRALLTEVRVVELSPKQKATRLRKLANELDPPSTFHPPTVEEIAEYVKEKGYNVNAQHFFFAYDKKGWMVGKNKMKSWHSAVAAAHHEGWCPATGTATGRQTGMSFEDLG